MNKQTFKMNKQTSIGSYFFGLVSLAILSLVLVGVLVGCSVAAKDNAKTVATATPVFYGLAQMHPTQGQKVTGKIWFSEAFGKVNVEAEVSGLEPNTKHGFHIHEFGNCSAHDGSSAGGHYNPMGHQHGNYTDETHHAGDLGNLVTDKKGNAKMTFTVENLSVNGSVNPILGRAVIIHKNPDDLISQPTGGAGARIACGVIGAAALMGATSR